MKHICITNMAYYDIWQGINETCPCTTLHNTRKLTKSMGSKGASPKSFARENQTCFCTRPKHGQSAIGFCREGGHPLSCIGVPPLHVLLLDSCCQGWRWRSLREWFGCSSVEWECGWLRDGDKCLLGLLGRWHCGWGTLISLWLTPMFGTGMSAPSSGLLG